MIHRNKKWEFCNDVTTKALNSIPNFQVISIVGVFTLMYIPFKIIIFRQNVAFRDTFSHARYRRVETKSERQTGNISGRGHRSYMCLWGGIFTNKHPQAVLGSKYGCISHWLRNLYLTYGKYSWLSTIECLLALNKFETGI